jgi:hypothetical protein
MDNKVLTPEDFIIRAIRNVEIPNSFLTTGQYLEEQGISSRVSLIKKESIQNKFSTILSELRKLHENRFSFVDIGQKSRSRFVYSRELLDKSFKILNSQKKI